MHSRRLLAVLLSLISTVAARPTEWPKPTNTHLATVIPQGSVVTGRVTGGPTATGSTPTKHHPQPAAATATYVSDSGKRGLAYNNDTFTLFFAQEGQDSLVSWAYNWYSEPYSTSTDTTFNPALMYIPLLFSNSSGVTDIWMQNAQNAINNGATALMSFNEPDVCFSGSACMSPESAAAAYQQYMMPFQGKALLGAPAVTNEGAPGGLTWLGEFMGNCTGCHYDFAAVHWYSNVYAGLSYLQSFTQQAYNQTQMPIWLTEFGIDDSAGTPTEAQIETFLEDALPYLDDAPFIGRYAYFYTGEGYEVNSDGTGLAEQGIIFNNYTASCPDWDNTSGTCS